LGGVTDNSAGLLWNPNFLGEVTELTVQGYSGNPVLQITVQGFSGTPVPGLGGCPGFRYSACTVLKGKAA
jgi:hypothetical protein